MLMNQGQGQPNIHFFGVFVDGFAAVLVSYSLSFALLSFALMLVASVVLASPFSAFLALFYWALSLLFGAWSSS